MRMINNGRSLFKVIVMMCDGLGQSLNQGWLSSVTLMLSDFSDSV